MSLRRIAAIIMLGFLGFSAGCGGAKKEPPPPVSSLEETKELPLLEQNIVHEVSLSKPPLVLDAMHEKVPSEELVPPTPEELEAAGPDLM